MAKIGSFAGVTFEVSRSKLLTFSDFSRSGDARWANHDVMQKKPVPEFLGPGQETLSLKIVLNAHFGISPKTELDKLRKFRDTGKVGSFVLGNSPITSGYWYIESLSEGYKDIDAKGRLHSVEVSLTLKEYPKPVIPVVKPKPKPKPQTKKPVVKKPKAKKELGTITIKVGMLNCRAKPSLKGKILKVLRKGQKYKVYGIKKTDIPWYDLGGGKWTSAVSKYTSLKKG